MINLISSTLASTSRKWRGSSAMVRKQQPAKPIRLYDRESSAECRAVRECLTELDLDVHIYPCPIGGDFYWDELKQLGGKKEVPMLFDENTGKPVYGAESIINYLNQNYGTRKPRTMEKPSLVSTLAFGLRLNAGSHYRPAKHPALPLELFSFESSPYSRPVRECLSELGLHYILRNSGKQQKADVGIPGLRLTLGKYQPIAGTKRAELLAKTGKVQYPYLYDPNTDVGMFESKDIIKYLRRTYSL